VVTASGSSVWELCCLGVPAALVCVSDNQQHSYERLLRRRAAVGLGSAAAGLDADAAATLRELLGDTGERERLSTVASRLVDGLGAWRVVRSWEQLAVRREPGRPAEPVQMRPADDGDTATLLRWRNDPVTRAGSRDTREVGPEQHRAWLSATLTAPDRHLLVARDDAGDLGTLRWDRVGAGEWEVSLTVAPERRGRGLAAPLLRAGEDWLAEHEPAAHTMLAAVHVDNAPSQRLFDTAGYLPERTPDPDGFLGLIKQRVPSG
jgi:RimJ/RimL family protein N-acetyltransferase